MFDNLTQRFSRIVKDLRGHGRITEEHLNITLREVRLALLEADVALPVVRAFTEHVRSRALGAEVIGTLTPGQAVIRIVRDELTSLMGEAVPLNLNTSPPVVVLVAGLQGSGKTTSVAKLARRLREQEGKSVLVVSCDVYRPAAIDQLAILAQEVEVGFFPAGDSRDPVSIALAALSHARKQFHEVLLVDTAGRLHIDQAMMAEIQRLHQALAPAETLFVVDSMMGQDAVNTARAFNEALPLTGVILTKTDGDARGGAALSVRHVTGKPIKFMGTGEKTPALEPFYPDRVATQILGMGDILGLIEEVERTVDRDKAYDLAQKLKKGQGFDLEDFREQIRQMEKAGGLSNLITKLPGMTEIPPEMLEQVNNRDVMKIGAIIDSMTRYERRFPAIIRGSRKRRIASGSGTEVQDVNRLLKQFAQMQKVMKQMSKKGGLAKLMRTMGRIAPRGLPF
ncbi:MAG TPA: signal recognition particle protein [Gammaproteobacteria bacterium]|nr:signal recognition particle protein [Gammaproteobacteria bacterium]